MCVLLDFVCLPNVQPHDQSHLLPFVLVQVAVYVCQGPRGLLVRTKINLDLNFRKTRNTLLTQTHCKCCKLGVPKRVGCPV